MRHIPGLYLSYTDKGRSIFTAESLQQGSIIETCPVILIPEEEREKIHDTVLHDYYFIWPEGGIAIALGYGSIYNHSEQPNAIVVYDLKEREIIFEASRNIEAGEEICIDYTDGDPEILLWFEVK